MEKPGKQSTEPYGHQKWLAGHLAERRVSERAVDDSPAPGIQTARLETPEGKPVVITKLDMAEHGTRIDVSRGSKATGDLATASSVAVSEVVPDGHMPEINPARTATEMQDIIDDLRKAA